MKVAIMQPYFFPYIGYFQLISSVDTFVVYDNIQFSKKGWFHRNRILVNGKDKMFTVPLKKDSDYLDVKERKLADSFDVESKKILRKISYAYNRAPYYREVMPLLEQGFAHSNNLFSFIFASLKLLLNYFEIDTEIVISSTVDIDHSLKAHERVVAICQKLDAGIYVNAAGGKKLYSKELFSEVGLKLFFLNSNPIVYKQFDNEFIPWLSIIDVMMFNSKNTIMKMFQQFKLV